MRKKIGNFMVTAGSEIEYRLRLLCGRPSPLKRFVTVLILGGVLAVANIYLVVSSIYKIGKRDAEKEFMELRHIEALKLQQRKDSINLIENGKLRMENLNIKNNDKYEYE